MSTHDLYRYSRLPQNTPLKGSGVDPLLDMFNDTVVYLGLLTCVRTLLPSVPPLQVLLAVEYLQQQHPGVQNRRIWHFSALHSTLLAAHCCSLAKSNMKMQGKAPDTPGRLST